jgi:hypothetical protein
MVHLDLSDEEALLLRELLESRWEELLKEIRHTDHREFRDLLKARSAGIEHVIAQLAAAPAVH